jgi:hypothetical protein
MVLTFLGNGRERVAFQIHSVEKQAQNNPMGGADRHSLSLRDFDATNDTVKATSYGSRH